MWLNMHALCKNQQDIVTTKRLRITFELPILEFPNKTSSQHDSNIGQGAYFTIQIP